MERNKHTVLSGREENNSRDKNEQLVLEVMLKKYVRHVCGKSRQLTKQNKKKRLVLDRLC